MKLNCPNCHTPIPVPAINIDQTIAVCPACGEVFNFASLIPAQKAHDRKIKQPPGMEIIESPDALIWRFSSLPRSPMQRAVTQTVYLLLALLGVLLTLLIGANAQFSAAMIALVVSPLLMLYIGMAGLLNKRYVRLTDDQLQSYIRPLRMFNGKTIPRDQITGVNSQTNTRAAYYGQRTYDVDIQLRGGDEQVLIAELNGDYAQFIAQEIEAALGSEEEAQDVFSSADEATNNLQDYEQPYRQARSN